eukprot:m.86403 g.86403  ORF g.86403 m.86403 type:complete len:91 (+) comp12805_c0_seq1:113-385(+)
MSGMFGVATAMLRGARRGVMTSKRGNKNFYKGRGASPTGYHTRKGGYVQDPFKRVEFVVPNLENCELKPYVSLRAPLVKGKVPTPEMYLE